jgi:hypothetical protein
VILKMYGVGRLTESNVCSAQEPGAAGPCAIFNSSACGINTEYGTIY